MGKIIEVGRNNVHTCSGLWWGVCACMYVYVHIVGVLG